MGANNYVLTDFDKGKYSAAEASSYPSNHDPDRGFTGRELAQFRESLDMVGRHCKPGFVRYADPGATVSPGPYAPHTGEGHAGEFQLATMSPGLDTHPPLHWSDMHAEYVEVKMKAYHHPIHLQPYNPNPDLDTQLQKNRVRHTHFADMIEHEPDATQPMQGSAPVTANNPGIMARAAMMPAGSVMGRAQPARSRLFHEADAATKARMAREEVERLKGAAIPTALDDHKVTTWEGQVRSARHDADMYGVKVRDSTAPIRKDGLKGAAARVERIVEAKNNVGEGQFGW